MLFRSQIVTTVRGDTLSGLISIESPLGKAILGHKVNDRVYVTVKQDVGYYVVVKSITNTQDDGTTMIRKY